MKTNWLSGAILLLKKYKTHWVNVFFGEKNHKKKKTHWLSGAIILLKKYKKTLGQSVFVFFGKNTKTNWLCNAIFVGKTVKHIGVQSSRKCCQAGTACRAEQGSCEPISELRARSREREIGSQSSCSQLKARKKCKREIGSQSSCSQLKAREKCKREIGSQSSCSQLKA